MDDLINWLKSFEPDRINSYDELKRLIYEDSKEDYVFFSQIIGCVRNFIYDNATANELKYWVLKVIKDLLLENKIEVIYDVKNDMEIFKVESNSDIEILIDKIHNDWEALKDKEDDFFDLILIQAKESNS